MASLDDQKKKADPARWQRQWEIFDQALTLPQEDRQAALDQLCEGDETLRQEVESLLLAHDGDVLAESPLAGLMPAVFDEDQQKPEIDRYQLQEPLGSGGMGHVFAARRADGLYDEVVAVKVLKRGLDTDALIQRFQAERRILARLAHPHIARLLDGGSTADGRPYLVMERVVGICIDQYCDQHELAIPQRLELFQQVCRAVHFAHRNLVVHRDLKPSNILITKNGEPKLLDFGIAKLLDSSDEHQHSATLTQPGQAPMTPQYASPEQVTGQVVTTASDVYSLGMLLYKLLTDDLPYRLGPGMSPLQVICEVDLEKPSRRISPAALGKVLQGDLDNVVLKALAKDPEQRYASAEALAEDLERYSEGLPIRARPSSLGYRAKKFARRHRLAVSFGTAAISALLLLLATLLLQRRQILDERDRVVEEHSRATFATDFLVELFAIPDPTRAQGETVTARQLLERGVDQIEAELATEPRIQGSLLLSMGRSMAGLGLYEEALTLLQRSLALRREDEAEDPEAVAEALFRTADVLRFLGRYEEAELLLREVMENRRKSLEPTDARIAEVHGSLGDLMTKQGRLDLAADEFVIANALARAAGMNELLAKILDRHATLLQKQGHLEQAQALFDEALTLSRDIHGDSNTWLAVRLNNSALLAAKRGDFDRADTLYREAEGIQRRLFDGDHSQLATTLANRGLLALDQADIESAETLLLDAIAMYQTTLGALHPKVATTLSNLATLETQRGRLDLAETHYREVLSIQDQTLGRQHEATANTLNNLAQVLALAGRSDEADDYFRQALDILIRELSPKHPRVGVTLANLADIAQHRGDLEAAEGLSRQAVEILRSSSDDPQSHLAAALNILALVQEAMGDLAGAAASSEEAVAMMRSASGNPHPSLAKILTRLASFHAQLGKFAEAESEANEALEIFRNQPSEDEGWTQAAERIRARSQAGQGQKPPQ